MKKTSSLFLAAALSCIAMSAAAGGSHGSQGSNGAAGGGGGGGGGGGAGFGVGIAGAGASSRTQVGIATTVGLGVTTGATTATGGLGFGGNASVLGGANTATGGSVGSGAVQVSAGNSTYRAASAPAFAPPASGPIRSCRLFVGLGTTTTSGSLSGGVPIGNDQACVVDSSHEMMNRLNALKPGAFKYVDYLRPACKFEGLAETDECKALAQLQSAAAPVGMAYTPN